MLKYEKRLIAEIFDDTNVVLSYGKGCFVECLGYADARNSR